MLRVRNLNRSRNRIVPRREKDDAIKSITVRIVYGLQRSIDGRLDCCGVISNAIAGRTVILDVENALKTTAQGQFIDGILDVSSRD